MSAMRFNNNRAIIGKLNKKQLLTILVAIICFVGLIIQTLYLLEDYLSGRTIVNIRFQRLHQQPIPGFTICYPCYMSMEMAVKLNPEYELKYKEYKDLIDSKSVNDSYYTEDIIKKSFYLYFDVYNPVGGKRPDSLPVLQLFNKLSIPLNLTYKGEFRPSIIISANGIYEDQDGSMSWQEFKDMDPIESFASEYQALCIRKCYTFFSGLNRKWRDFNLDLDYMTIDVIHDNYWFSPHIYDWDSNSFFLSMHSPNILPNIIKGENFLLLESKKKYLLTYSLITTELLDSRFDTNCREYDLNENVSQVNMRSDCTSLCILSAMKSECHIDCVFQTEDLLRKQLFERAPAAIFCPEHMDQTINDCLNKNILLYKSKCSKSCQSACRDIYYDWDLKSENYMLNPVWEKRVFINVKHNRLPDQVVKHFPETTFISFISNFGGLLGMWLGMSVLTSFVSFYEYMERRKLRKSKNVLAHKFNSKSSSVFKTRDTSFSMIKRGRF